MLAYIYAIFTLPSNNPDERSNPVE